MLRLLLLTEDTGGDASATQKTLAEKMLRLVAAGCAIERIDFATGDKPTRNDFNAYKSTNKRDYHKKIDLAAAITTHLLRPDIQAFVFVHLDGDRRWSERGDTASTLCMNRSQFETNIVARIQEILRQKQRPELIERLLFVLPFYSVESWLYQNSVELAAICTEHHPHHERYASLLQSWREDPSCLDELEQPKKASSLQDKYNARLAGSLPARKVYDLGLSFTATVDALKTCRPLITALETLRYPGSAT